jgi:hypothetical protein
MPSHLISHCAADISPEPVQWLWRGRIAIGKQTLIAGEAGLGKSQVVIALAAAVTTGGPLPCREGRAPLGNVVIFSAEDTPEDIIVPRLMAAHADRGRVRIVRAVRDGKARRGFNLQTDLMLLEQEIVEIEQKLGRVVLVIFDPVSSYLGQKIDSHVNTAVRSVLEPLSEIASLHQAAFVSITHPPKGVGTTAINRFIGSVAFIAAARAAFMIIRDAEDETRRLFLPVKNNLAPLGKGLAFRLEQRIVGDPGKGIVASSVTWEHEPVNMSADEALRAVEDDSDNKALSEAVEFLQDRLSNGAVVAAKEVEEHARALGITPRTLTRARKKVGVIPKKGGLKEGWTWRLPPEGGQGTPKGATSNIWPPSENLAAFEEDQRVDAFEEGQGLAAFEEGQKTRRGPKSNGGPLQGDLATFGDTPANAGEETKETGAPVAPPKAPSASDPWKDLDLPEFLDRRPREERTCVQCRGRVDGKERLVPVGGGRTVRLHPECVCFYLKGRCVRCGELGDAERGPVTKNAEGSSLHAGCGRELQHVTAPWGGH